MKTVEVKAQVEIPTVPNFVKMTNGHKMKLGDLDEETIAALGHAWTQELRARAAQQRQGGK